MTAESDETLEAAERAGEQYAQEQVAGDYFQDWVREQLAEGEQLRREEPDKFIAINSPRGASDVAKNLLQQLDWDTRRDMDASVIAELVGAEGPEVTRAFFRGFSAALREPATRQWLADIVLDVGKEIAGGRQEVGESQQQKRFAITFIKPWPKVSRHTGGSANTLAQAKRIVINELRAWPTGSTAEIVDTHTDRTVWRSDAQQKVSEASRQQPGMTPEQRITIEATLQRYGAHLTDDNFVAKGEKVTGVRFDVKKGRLRAVSRDGQLFASFPTANIAAGVANFVEKFWYWKPKAVSEATHAAREARFAREPSTVSFEFPSADAAARFTERIAQPCVRNHRVVDVQGAVDAEVMHVAKDLRGYRVAETRTLSARVSERRRAPRR